TAANPPNPAPGGVAKSKRTHLARPLTHRPSRPQTTARRTSSAHGHAQHRTRARSTTAHAFIRRPSLEPSDADACDLAELVRSADGHIQASGLSRATGKADASDLVQFIRCARGHTRTKGFSWAKRWGPMPVIWRSSSTVWKLPCWVR